MSPFSPALLCTLLTNRKSRGHRFHKPVNEQTGLVRQAVKKPTAQVLGEKKGTNRPSSENIYEDIFAKE